MLIISSVDTALSGFSPAVPFCLQGEHAVRLPLNMANSIHLNTLNAPLELPRFASTKRFRKFRVLRELRPKGSSKRSSRTPKHQKFIRETVTK